MLYNGQVGPIELSARLRADLVAAAEDADAYHHVLCGAGEDDPDTPDGDPLPCTCPGPRLIRDMATALEVGYIGPGRHSRAA